MTTKVALLVAVPLLAAVAFAGLAVFTTGGEAVRADRLRQLVGTGAAAGALAHQLQVERAGAVMALTAGSSELAAAYDEQVAATQQATDRYQRVRADLPEQPAGAAALLERIDGQLARLAPLREQVVGGQGAASAVAFTYRIVIADLVGFRESVAQAGGATAEAADQLRAAAALSQAAEQVGRQQVAVVRAAEFGSLTPAASQEITAARTGHIEAALTFDLLAEPAWRDWLEQSTAGEDALAARRLEDEVARTRPGDRLRVDPVEWTAALGTRMQQLHQVETRVDAEVLAEVTALRDAQRRWAALQTAAVVLAVALAVGLAIWLGHPVVRGLRGLRDAAHRVAYQELPRAVSRLEERREELGGLSPEQFADQARPPVRVRGRDELAEVGQAFNAVHREAIRTAAAQALLRLHIAAIFVQLARRGQSLTGRLTAALDEAEQREQDPQRLQRLFKLDLLATLLGRTNDSLLVLGGASPAQVRTAPEPLPDVLTAAQSQVEAYARIEIGVVDEGVVVRAECVDEVAKLLAELMDNACRYSQPATAVRVDARWLRDRLLVQVSDEGVGIDPARLAVLNQRLASRPELDLTAVQAMGLTVVGQIAARHGIRVELRHATPRGTVAEVTLPAAVVAVGAGPTGRPAAPATAGRMPAQPRGATGPVSPAAPLFRPGAGAPAGEDDRATMELHLPIFEQVQSHWFSATTTAELSETVPDPGWQAALQATEPTPAGRTGSGLPKRDPGAQLVPGSLSAPETAELDDWRDPASVSAALTAYSRGLASGRAVPVTTDN